MPSVPTSLATLYPQPRSLRLAGLDLVVAELRVKDVAELEAWLAEASDPLRNLPHASDDPDPDSRPQRLDTAEQAALVWPPAVGSPEADALLATLRGRVAYLQVILSRENPDLVRDDYLTLARGMTSGEWASLDRVAWGVHPLKTIRQEKYQADGRHPLADWGELLDVLSRERGWTFDEISNLTMGQLAVAARHGKPLDSTEGLPSRLKNGRGYLKDRWRSGLMRPTPIKTALANEWVTLDELPSLIETIGIETAHACGWCSKDGKPRSPDDPHQYTPIS